MIKKIILIIFLLEFPCILLADNLHIAVLALTQDKAVIDIDGQYHTLAIGQTSPEGVTLVQADSEIATLEIDGKKQQYGLNGTVTTLTAKEESTELPTIRIFPNAQGLYTITGYINGYPVDFIVDTGASSIAMSSIQAEHMNIHYQRDGTKVNVMTASDTIPAHLINLDKVKVGYIVLQHVEAVVIDGKLPEQVLLGMSFLDKVEMHRKKDLLELRQAN